MNKEIWKDIKGYEGYYQVSNLGRIKSIPRLCINPRGSYVRKEMVMKHRKDKDGYLQITLTKNRKRNTQKIHRLVAKEFIPNPNNYTFINHKDETRDNNCVNNLEWCTPKYNCNYGTAIQRKSKPVIQYNLNGEIIKKWESMSKCGGKGFNISAISKCCRGGSKTHMGYRWELYK